MKVLVVAAHPDDELLGCGGTVARWAAEGHDVRSLILAEGATSRGDDREGEVERLQVAARQAASILGTAIPTFGGFPDNRMDTVPLLDVVKVVETVIDEWRPHTVLTHFGGDLNVDHQICFRAVLTATRPMQDGPVKRILAFETPSSTEWAQGEIGRPFRPTTYVDITGSLDQKIKALGAYDMEMRPMPHPRSVEHIRAKAAVRGNEVGLVAAEAFETVRGIE